MIQLLVENVFSLLGQILHKLAFFHMSHKKEERKERHCDVTENMWCDLTDFDGLQDAVCSVPKDVAPYN